MRLRLQPMRCAAISSTYISSPTTRARVRSLFNASFTLRRSQFGTFTFSILSYCQHYYIVLMRLRLQPMRCAVISSTYISSPATRARAHSLFNASFTLRRPQFGTLTFIILSYFQHYYIVLVRLRLRPMRCAVISSTYISSPNTRARVHSLFNASFTLLRPQFATFTFSILSYYHHP